MTPRLLQRRGSVGGFNLLPWRRREILKLRRRRAFEWLAAALLGCACAVPLAGWRVWQRMQIDGERRALEESLAALRAPLAEQRRLAREAGERRLRDALAQENAKPLARIVGLVDRLATASVEGVSLDQVVHRAHETLLHATVSGEAATAAWLARLRAMPEVESVSVREIKRATGGAGGARADERQPDSLQLTAQLVWVGADAAGAPGTAPRGRADKRGGRSLE